MSNEFSLAIFAILPVASITIPGLVGVIATFVEQFGTSLRIDVEAQRASGRRRCAAHRARSLFPGVSTAKWLAIRTAIEAAFADFESVRPSTTERALRAIASAVSLDRRDCGILGLLIRIGLGGAAQELCEALQSRAYAR